MREPINSLLNRIAEAAVVAIGAGAIVSVVSCLGFTELILRSDSHDHDGQTGMAAMFGGFYVGCVAALITFIVSLRRSSPSRRAKNGSQ